MESITELKRKLCEAGRKAAEELIKIAEEPIINRIAGSDDESATEDLSADKMTRAAQAKKICIMDGFEILSKVESEEALLSQIENPSLKPIPKSFAENRAKPSK